jgi:chromosomal replication initiator protein
MNVSLYALPNLYEQRKKELTEKDFPEILDIVSKKTRIPKRDIIGPFRKAEFVDARFIFFFVAKSNTKASLKKIGAFCGGRDHTTVINGLSTIKDLVDIDPKLKKQVERINMAIKSFTKSNLSELIGSKHVA